MVEKATVSMEYRHFGNSGLKVFVISYGGMLSNDTEEDLKWKI